MYGPPAPETTPGRLTWRDAGFGWLPGFRPLTLDLFRPAGDGPHPVALAHFDKALRPEGCAGQA